MTVIKARIERIDKMIAMYEQEKAKLRNACTHGNVTYKAGANTGNYDPHADCYWYDLTCKDCGERNHVDQRDWNPHWPNQFLMKGKTWGIVSVEEIK